MQILPGSLACNQAPTLVDQDFWTYYFLWSMYLLGPICRHTSPLKIPDDMVDIRDVYEDSRLKIVMLANTRVYNSQSILTWRQASGVVAPFKICTDKISRDSVGVFSQNHSFFLAGTCILVKYRSSSPRSFTLKPKRNMCQGLNSHYFHIIGDGHQPNSRGYIPIIRIPIKGGMTIPNIATFDHGTYQALICLGFLRCGCLTHMDRFTELGTKCWNDSEMTE